MLYVVLFVIVVSGLNNDRSISNTNVDDAFIFVEIPSLVSLIKYCFLLEIFNFQKPKKVDFCGKLFDGKKTSGKRGPA